MSEAMFLNLVGGTPMPSNNPYLGQALSQALERVLHLKNGDALTNLPVTDPDHINALQHAERHIVDAMIHDQEGFTGRFSLRSAMNRAMDSLVCLEQGKN